MAKKQTTKQTKKKTTTARKRKTTRKKKAGSDEPTETDALETPVAEEASETSPATSGRKKQTRKRTTKKTTRSAAANAETDTATATKTAKTKRTRGTRKRKAAPSTAAESTGAATAAPVESPPAKSTRAAKSPNAQVEATDGAIVIRFPTVGKKQAPAAPPVAEPPAVEPPVDDVAPEEPLAAAAPLEEETEASFVAETPDAEPLEETEPPIDLLSGPPAELDEDAMPETFDPDAERETSEPSQFVPDSTADDERRTRPDDRTDGEKPRSKRGRRRRGRRKHDPRDGEAAETTATDEQTETRERRDESEPAEAKKPLEEIDERSLTPSQRRRLRRKRRMLAKREGADKDADNSADQPVDEAPTERADDDDEPVSEDEELIERAEFVDEERADVVDEERTEAVDEEPTEPRSDRRRRRRRGGRSRGKGAEARPAEAPAEAPRPPSGKVAAKEMIINMVPREECRIAILERGKLQEIYFERSSAENHVGNIYKGVVTNVEASIQAAFIDFGLGKNGFLHISDLHPQYFPHGDKESETVGRKMPRRNRPPIQRCLRRGQELLVQITKEGIGTKGPTLTTYLSIPGRYLVMMPGMRQLGVSRKIEDDQARRKLRDQLGELQLPDNIGFIARTAALDRTKRELQSDLNYLTRLWRAVEVRIKKDRAPAELYTESDLVIRTIRDAYTSDIERIVIDDPEIVGRAKEFLSIFSPRSGDIVVQYENPEPIFHRYAIEAELDRLHSRHVPLRSGGSLVIDPTEALVAIDVNSGRFRTEDDAETTAFKINVEAADEISRQLRLRDLGGVVVCDFIDMRLEKHKREVERRLIRNLKEHKERAKVLRTSAFGLVELTRQRQRTSLTRSVYQDCPHCRGSGLVKTIESVALDAMRLIQLASTRENVRSIDVAVSPNVADVLQNRKRSVLNDLEKSSQRSIAIRASAAFGADQLEIQCYDQRGRLVPHP